MSDTQVQITEQPAAGGPTSGPSLAPPAATPSIRRKGASRWLHNSLQAVASLRPRRFTMASLLRWGAIRT